MGYLQDTAQLCWKGFASFTDHLYNICLEIARLDCRKQPAERILAERCSSQEQHFEMRSDKPHHQCVVQFFIAPLMQKGRRPEHLQRDLCSQRNRCSFAYLRIGQAALPDSTSPEGIAAGGVQHPGVQDLAYLETTDDI